MKRVLVSFLLALGLSVPISIPAHAIFGLSTCEKVKKQVVTVEKQINSNSDFWNRYIGKTLPDNQITKFEFQKNPANDLMLKLTKISYNNPKCFTRTQNDEINARKKQNVNFESLTLNSRNPILRLSKKCQDVWERLDPSAECLIKWEYKINKVYSLNSLYTY